MGSWELAARITAWPVVVAGLQACRAGGAPRWWRIGFGLLLVHEAVAFFGVHGGSHARAVADTARQVEAVTGIAFGAGIHANYLFTLLWGVAAAGWGRLPEAARRVWQGLFLFFAFQGAVVFAGGWGRAAGVLAFLVWMVLVLRDRRARSGSGAGPTAG